MLNTGVKAIGRLGELDTEGETGSDESDCETDDSISKIGNDEVPIDICVTEFRQMMESAMALFEPTASSEQANYASNMREISRALRGYSKFLKFTTL